MIWEFCMGVSGGPSWNTRTEWMRSVPAILIGVLVTGCFTSVCRAEPEPAAAWNLVEAEDRERCTVTGRVETHIFPRTVGRRIAVLHAGSSLTLTTDRPHLSLILPPVFQAPGPRYDTYLECRLRVRVDAQPWRELALATSHAETVLAEGLPAGTHTVTVEPLTDIAPIDAFRLSTQPLGGFTGCLVSTEFGELLTDVRADIFRDGTLIRTDYVRTPFHGRYELLGLPPGRYTLRFEAAGWLPLSMDELTLTKPGERFDVGTRALKRDPRMGGREVQDRPGPRFGRTLVVGPGETFRTLISLPGKSVTAAALVSPYQRHPLEVLEAVKLPIGIWNDAAAATFKLPQSVPHDLYDLVFTCDSKQGEVTRVAGQAVAVREALPSEFVVAGCGHMNTWGQQTAEYLRRVGEVAQLAGARSLLVANEVNAAYISGALADLRIPYVVSRGNHTMPRWDEFYGATSQAHDDGPLRIVSFGRWPYETWDEVRALFRDRPTATNRVVVCYEGFAPIELIREAKINLLFDGHSDNAHADRDAFPPGTLQLRAPTQDTLRLIPMTRTGLSPSVKSAADVPVLKIPRTGESPLRVLWESPNDGTATTLRGTLANETPLAFPHARLRLVLKSGSYRVTGARVLQTFRADDGQRTVIDVEAAVAEKSTTTITALPFNHEVRTNPGS